MGQFVTPTLAQISAVNRSRGSRWHDGAAPWSGADWSNAMCGEAGEAANIVKKIRRHETSISTPYNTPPMEKLIPKLAEEIADVIIYADLLAWHYHIDTERSVIDKFNRVSEAQGFPERLERRLRGYDE